MWDAFDGVDTMRDQAFAPIVPEVSSETTTSQPAIRADGGLRKRSEEALVADAALVPDLS